MAESGTQACSSDSVDDKSLQELEIELRDIQAQIQEACKKQDRKHELRTEIEAAKKELAVLTGEEKQGI